MTRAFGCPPSTVFRHFDPNPIATASVAQVHRATLMDGRAVVVKVNRFYWSLEFLLILIGVCTVVFHHSVGVGVGGVDDGICITL